MARTPINLPDLEGRALEALARLPWWAPDLPSSHQRPQVYRAILSGLAGELPSKIARSRDFLAARAAVERWAGAQSLYEKAVALYHNPAIRVIAG
jgi:hypothetical protein